jgi:hypothetical protein
MRAIDDVVFLVAIGRVDLRIAYGALSKLPSCTAGRKRCNCRAAGLSFTFVSSMN